MTIETNFLVLSSSQSGSGFTSFVRIRFFVYKYFDMKIEVFKDYCQALRQFDGTWKFDSENHRDGKTCPPYRRGLGNPEYNEEYSNRLAPEPKERAGTIFFDSQAAAVKVYSTQENVVIDTNKPVVYESSIIGRYTAFKKYVPKTTDIQETPKVPDLSTISGSRQAVNYINQDQRTKWHFEAIFRDDAGIDGEVYELYDVSTGETFFAYSRKESTGPYWFSQRSTGFSLTGVNVKFTQSQYDKCAYKIEIDIDPESLTKYTEYEGYDPEDKDRDGFLHKCNDHFSYLKLGIRIFDISGNVYDTHENGDESDIIKPFVLFNVSKTDLLKDVRPLIINFIDTYPPNMFIEEDMIGHTTVEVTNPNTTILEYGFKFKIGLLDGSVGYISEKKLYSEEDRDPNIDFKLVDGIDSSGYVKAYAYLDGEFGNVSCKIGGETVIVELDKDFCAELRALTYTEGKLGRFIVECESNKRKIYIDPFVPSVLKHEGIYGLCKLLERYLNTMYTPMSGDCRIGILEKIDRISHFKDPDTCEPELLTRFADEHGSELSFNHDDVKKAAETLRKYFADEDYDTEEIVEQIYRRYYSILPYIDRWKGTDESIYLLYRVLGINATVVPLWEGPNGDMVPEEEAGDDYRLSSHIRIALKSDKIKRKDMVALSNFAIKAVKSILPVVRVISEVRADDETESDATITITVVKNEGEIVETKNVEKILFVWKPNSIKKAVSHDNYYTVELDAYPGESVEVRHQPKEKTDANEENYHPEYPIPDYAGFYFSRLKDYLKTFQRSDVSFTIATLDEGNELRWKPDIDCKFIVKDIKIVRNKILLEVDGSKSEINKFNTNVEDPSKYLTIGFLFTRHIENYCEPITLSKYWAFDTPEDPFDAAQTPDEDA